MKKSLIFWFAAATCAAWILVGCEQEAKTEYVTQKEVDVIHVDEVVDSDGDLAAALLNDDYKVIEVDASGGAVTLSTVTEIPAGKTVIIRGGSVTPASGGLTIKGVVYVELEGVLVAANATKVIVTDGVLYVSRGTLSVDATASVNNGAESPATVLGTGKVGIAGGTLTYTAATDLDTAAKIGTALGYVTSGTLDIGSSTLKPSAIAGVTIPAGKKLVATTGAAETETTLTIPAWLDLTSTTVALASPLTSLTVNGKLTTTSGTTTLSGVAITIGDGGVLDVGVGANFAPASVTSVENGKLVVAPAAIATLKTILDAAGAGGLNIEASPGALTLTAATEVKAKTVLTLKAGSITTATGSCDLTVKGKIIAGGLTIDGNNNAATGITTAFGAGVTIDAASATAGLEIGIADKITIPAGASINVGGEDGITLGAGTYSAVTAAVTIKLAAGVPTLSGTSNFVFNVGADTDEGGLLTVGSGSAIVKVGTAKVFTANTETSPAPAKLAVNIAAGATITNSSDNDGGITLSDGAIAARNTNIPGVSESVGLQLLGSDAESAGWKKGTPVGVES